MNLPLFAVLLAETPPLAEAAGLPDAQTIFWRFALIVLFVLLNGFFVAAEFALVKVRASQLDEIVAESESKAAVARATRARVIISNLSSYLSASQLGITICSLVLGALGEPFVHMVVEPLLGVEHGIGLPDWWVKTISWAVAIGSITALHVVIGEQMPKQLGLARALGTAQWVGAPLAWFHWTFKPVIWLLDTASNKLLKWMFGIEPTAEHAVHSAEELGMLVKQSGQGEEVTETERDILINALQLSERIVRDIMTPRASIVALDVSRPFEENRRTAIESKHTRFPLIDKHLENTLGLVHVKDLFAKANGQGVDLRTLKRPLLAVPELMPLDKLLTFFLNKHAHLALVVDEFGGTIGMVTLDDVMEEVVGEIHDEFDTEEKRFQKIDEDEFLVDGGMPLYELSEYCSLQLESDDVSTIGGYVTDELGHLPTAGETVAVEDYIATVVKTDGHRVVQIHFKRQPPALVADTIVVETV